VTHWRSRLSGWNASGPPGLTPESLGGHQRDRLSLGCTQQSGQEDVAPTIHFSDGAGFKRSTAVIAAAVMVLSGKWVSGKTTSQFKRVWLPLLDLFLFEQREQSNQRWVRSGRNWHEAG
jgi:hypothetical protein